MGLKCVTTFDRNLVFTENLTVCFAFLGLELFLLVHIWPLPLSLICGVWQDGAGGVETQVFHLGD